MIEINLLRWRQAEKDWPLEEKWRKLFIILTIILLAFFTSLHIFLYNANFKSNAIILKLKNKMTLYQVDKSDELKQDDFSLEKMSQIKFWRILNLSSCLALHQIQIVKINFQEKQINISGWVHSSIILSKSLQICLPDNALFSIKKLTFNHKNNVDFFQLSI